MSRIWFLGSKLRLFGLLMVMALVMAIWHIPRVITIEAAKCEDSLNPDSTSSVRVYVACEAREFGVDVSRALFISWKESQYDPTRIGDDHLICPRNGQKQASIGLWQINSCWNPQVGRAEALDVVSSTLWAMPRLKTSPNIWSTWKYRKLWYTYYPN